MGLTDAYAIVAELLEAWPSGRNPEDLVEQTPELSRLEGALRDATDRGGPWGSVASYLRTSRVAVWARLSTPPTRDEIEAAFEAVLQNEAMRRSYVVLDGPIDLGGELRLCDECSVLAASGELTAYLNGLVTAPHQPSMLHLRVEPGQLVLRIDEPAPRTSANNLFQIECAEQAQRAFELTFGRRTSLVRFAPAEGSVAPTVEVYALRAPGFRNRHIATDAEKGALLDCWRVLRGLWAENQLSVADADLERVLRRFRRALTSSEDDLLLDLMTCIEGLFSGQPRELRYRYSLMAAASLSETADGRREVFRWFMKAYDTRSGIAHGGAPKNARAFGEQGRSLVASVILVALRWCATGRTLGALREELEASLVEGRHALIHR